METGVRHPGPCAVGFDSTRSCPPQSFCVCCTVFQLFEVALGWCVRELADTCWPLSHVLIGLASTLLRTSSLFSVRLAHLMLNKAVS